MIAKETEQSPGLDSKQMSVVNKARGLTNRRHMETRVHTCKKGLPVTCQYGKGLLTRVTPRSQSRGTKAKKAKIFRLCYIQ